MSKQIVAHKETTSLKDAVAFLRKRFDKPMFVPPHRRYIPMKHRALGELLSGFDHPGLPSGTFIEVVGQAHTGKTSLTFAMMEAMLSQPESDVPVLTSEGIEQRPVPRKVLYVDSEQALDIRYMLQAVPSGVLLQTSDTGKLLNERDANVWVHQPDTLEEGGDVMLKLLETGQFGMVVLDSVAAMLPIAEREKPMGERTTGALAQAMGKFFRVSSPMVRRYGVVCVLINQWRDKISMGAPIFGDPRTKPGGKAADFYDAIKLDISGPHKTPYFESGKVVNIKAMKNKVTGDKTLCQYHLQTGFGLSAEIEALETAIGWGAAKLNAKSRGVSAFKKKGGEWVKQWKSVQDFIDAARRDPTIIEKLWAACERRGYKGGAVTGNGLLEQL